MEQLEDTLRGYGLWRKKEPCGEDAYSYWINDCGIERQFWNDCLDDPRLMIELFYRLDMLKHLLSVRIDTDYPSVIVNGRCLTSTYYPDYKLELNDDQTVTLVLKFSGEKDI